MKKSWTVNQWVNQCAFAIWLGAGSGTPSEMNRARHIARRLASGRAGFPIFWQSPKQAAAEEIEYIHLVRSLTPESRLGEPLPAEVDDTDWFYTGASETVPAELTDTQKDSLTALVGGVPGMFAPRNDESRSVTGLSPVPRDSVAHAAGIRKQPGSIYFLGGQMVSKEAFDAWQASQPEHERPPFAGNASELVFPPWPVIPPYLVGGTVVGDTVVGHDARKAPTDIPSGALYDVFPEGKPLAMAVLPDLVIDQDDDGAILCRCRMCIGSSTEKTPIENTVTANGCVFGQLPDDQGVPPEQQGGKRTYTS